MKILILGSGGREHALAWAVKRSQRVSEVVCAPGNGGIARLRVACRLIWPMWRRWFNWSKPSSPL